MSTTLAIEVAPFRLVWRSAEAAGKDAGLRTFSATWRHVMASRHATSTPNARVVRGRYGGTFTAVIFRWAEGKGSWYFVQIPDRYAPAVTHAWGRAPVTATVDGSTWKTSVWRGKDGRCLLAVPKKVRGANGDGDRVRVTIAFASL